MGISRRSFFKRSMALGTSGFVAAAPSLAHAAADTAKKPYKLVSTQEFTNICCYCAGGCGVICSVRNGELVNLEGDPDHPVNKGGLCPKGATMFNLRNVVTPDRKVKHNESRLLKPQVRRPGSDKWEDISWEDAFNEIARHVNARRTRIQVEHKVGDAASLARAVPSLEEHHKPHALKACLLLQRHKPLDERVVGFLVRALIDIWLIQIDLVEHGKPLFT